MNIYSIVVDDFLADFEAARKYADSAVYKDVENPADGVIYPMISPDLAPGMGSEIAMNLMFIMGKPIYMNMAFMRLSPAGVYVPHQAHTDKLMGEWSMMLYLNRPEHCSGGTSVLRHVTGMDRHPTQPEDIQIWREDMNDESKWQITDFCRMQTNRAFIFRSDLFHRAEPAGGFGRGPRNGRLVCTAFFNTTEPT